MHASALAMRISREKNSEVFQEEVKDRETLYTGLDYICRADHVASDNSVASLQRTIEEAEGEDSTSGESVIRGRI